MSTGTIRRTTLGSYRLVDFLGAGGMGEVYRGVHLATGRVAAVKILTASGRNPALIERFRNEGRIQSTLTHPHIVMLYDFFEAEGLPCIAMEYVSGESLDQILARGPLEPASALLWFAQVVDAVGYVHQRGVVHRDLKSNNIKINEQGQLKLLDFGIAKSGDSPKLTTDGGLVGTLHYLSPEQVQGAPATPASDIWALGVVLYEMLTGSVPFASESLTGVMAKILKGTYEPPTRHGAPLPASLTRIIARCLKLQPEQRYASAEALLTDVRAASAPVAVAVAPRRTSLQIPAPGVLVAFLKQRWPLLTAVSAAVASVVYFIWSTTMCCAPPPFDPRDTIAPRADTAIAIAPPEVNSSAPRRTVIIKTFGDGPAEVFRDKRKIGLTPLEFQAAIGDWINLTIRRAGHVDLVERFQVVDGINEYSYSLTRHQPPQSGGASALPQP